MKVAKQYMHIIPKEKSRTCGNVCKYWHYPNCQLLDPKMERYIDSLWNQSQVGMGSKTAEEIRAIGLSRLASATRCTDPWSCSTARSFGSTIRCPSPDTNPIPWTDQGSIWIQFVLRDKCRWESRNPKIIGSSPKDFRKFGSLISISHILSQKQPQALG